MQIFYSEQHWRGGLMVNDIEQFNKKAIKRIERLTNTALFANEHFKALHDTQELFSNNRQVFDMAYFYFQTTIFAHYTYIFIALTKMFCDQKDEAECCRNLLCKIVNRNDAIYNHPFDVTEYESTFSDESHLLHFESPKEAQIIINEEIDNWQTKLNRIKTLRDKYYAHMDRREAENYQKLFDDNEITMDEIDQLLNLNFTICNCLNSLLRNTTVLHSVIQVGSLDRLANYALKGKETERKDKELALQQFLNNAKQ